MTRSNVQPLTAGWPEPIEARVVSVAGPRAVQVSVGGPPFDATLATTGPYAPAVGDRVVVAAGRRGSWVIGVVGALREATTSDGVQASVEHDVLTVTGPRGGVLFTHDAATGVSTLRGREVKIAADEIDLSGRAVRIEGEEEIRIGRGPDALIFDERHTKLEAKRFRAELEDGRVSIRNAILRAGRVESAVRTAKHAVEVLDVTAGRIVERAKDVFRETEGVAQTRAGRIRMVAEGVFSLLSDRATIKAEDDVAIMGEKIELG